MPQTPTISFKIISTGNITFWDGPSAQNKYEKTNSSFYYSQAVLSIFLCAIILSIYSDPSPKKIISILFAIPLIGGYGLNKLNSIPQIICAFNRPIDNKQGTWENALPYDSINYTEISSNNFLVSNFSRLISIAHPTTQSTSMSES